MCIKYAICFGTPELLNFGVLSKYNSTYLLEYLFSTSKFIKNEASVDG